ncbi:hypothetical protein TNCV_1508511 [Trichonephila clavipes]|nr:hypothetical protein TNCV_1508511 [Trichonephila clavipes]
MTLAWLSRESNCVGLDDRNGQLIPCHLKSMLLFINHISWRGLVGQSLIRCFQLVTNLRIVQDRVAIENPVNRRRSALSCWWIAIGRLSTIGPNHWTGPKPDFAGVANVLRYAPRSLERLSWEGVYVLLAVQR